MADQYLNHLLGDLEKILLVTRQHWFVLFRAILMEIFGALALIIIVVIVRIFAPQAQIVTWLLLLLIPLAASATWGFIVWWNRKYIVTSRRVIQISGVVNKNVVDSSLEKVNDVRLTQSFLGRIFNYGDVEIMTASELGINKFTTLGHPVGFKTTMLNAKTNLEGDGDFRHSDQKSVPVTPDIPTQIAQMDALVKQGAITPEEFQKFKENLFKNPPA